MPTSYTVNGQTATQEQYNAAMANMPAMPAGFGERDVPGVPDGAEPLAPEPAPVGFVDVTGSAPPKDLRVKIRVPPKYLTAATSGPNKELANLGGIVFPYTPTISYEVKADYSAANPLHSNFAINFYQRSSITSISISGKFSVENASDAGVYLSTVHLLKSLTRMRSGGQPNAGGGRGGPSFNDTDSGAPPPVCRLDAYGDMMLMNVPVAITSFRVELPDSVDYFTTDSDIYGTNSVPTMSNIQITCLPMYSRDEMQRFSVTGYLARAYENRGYI
jgi:hypothetical protein